MKQTYFHRLTLAARWLLPPREAQDVLSEYREIVEQSDEAGLCRDLGDPVKAMRLLVQPRPYRRWLAAFAAMAACLLLPALSPLPGMTRLWHLWKGTLSRFPVEGMFLAAGLALSLLCFRGKEHRPAPRGLVPLLALQLAGAAGVWAVIWTALAQPQGAMDFFRAHAALARHVGDLLMWAGFLLALTGLWSLVQARLSDRRWRAAYVLGLTAVTLVMAALSILWRMDLNAPGWQNPYWRRCALLTALGLVGTGASLC